MNVTYEKSANERYSAWNNTKPINFYCDAPEAKAVYLVGDFNRWNSTTHPMERRLDGWWFLQVLLTHGHHHYRFLVDGKPMLDPHAAGVVRNELNEEVSLIAIS
jgi:1,4-alpha-glucan branching enzyme